MTIDDKIIDEKLQYDINREAVKILALSTRKINKYEYFTGEEILSSDQKRVTEQATFAYSPFAKAFVKQIVKRLKNREKTNRCYYKSKQKTTSFNQ